MLPDNAMSSRDLYNAINEFRTEVTGRFDRLEHEFSERYVTKERFMLVEMFVRGAITGFGLILFAILALVLKTAIPELSF